MSNLHALDMQQTTLMNSKTAFLQTHRAMIFDILDGGGRYEKAKALGTYRSNSSVGVSDKLNKREGSEWYRFRFRAVGAPLVSLTVSAALDSGTLTKTRIKAEILQRQNNQFRVVGRATSDTSMIKYPSLKAGEYYLKLARVPQTQEVMNINFFLAFY